MRYLTRGSVLRGGPALADDVLIGQLGWLRHLVRGGTDHVQGTTQHRITESGRDPARSQELVGATVVTSRACSADAAVAAGLARLRRRIGLRVVR